MTLSLDQRVKIRSHNIYHIQKRRRDLDPVSSRDVKSLRNDVNATKRSTSSDQPN